MLAGRDIRARFCDLPVRIKMKLKYLLLHSQNRYRQSTPTFKEERRQLSCRGGCFKEPLHFKSCGDPAFTFLLDLRVSFWLSLTFWQVYLLLESAGCVPPSLRLSPQSSPCPQSAVLAPGAPRVRAVVMDKTSSFITLSRNRNVICDVSCKTCLYFFFFFFFFN